MDPIEDDEKIDADPMDLIAGKETTPDPKTEPKVEEPKVDPKEAAEPAKETPAEKVEEPGEAAPAPTLEEAPKPGTPDKVLQQLQQDNAAAMRRIEALESKKEPLTQKEEQQLTDAKSKVAGVKKRLAEEYNVVEDGQATAEAVVEIDERLAKLEADNKALREERVADQKNRETAAEASRWAAAEALYPGVNVREIQNKAWADAKATLGQNATQDSLVKLSSRWFTERADAVKAAQAATKQKPVNHGKPVVPVDSSVKAATTVNEDDELADVMDLLAKPKK